MGKGEKQTPKFRAKLAKVSKRTLPPTHLYTQPLTPAQRDAVKIQNLSENVVARFRLADAAGIRSTQEGGALRLEGVCQIDPSHKAAKRTPELTPVTVPPDVFDFHCAGKPDGSGAHRISIEAWLKALYPNALDLRKFLAKIHICHVDLKRVHCFRHGDQYAESIWPNEALASMDLEDAETVHGVLLELVNPATAPQIIGQLGNKLPWRKDVRINADGTLADIAWHGHWLTVHERQLLHAQERLEQRAKHDEYIRRMEECQQLLAQELGL